MWISTLDEHHMVSCYAVNPNRLLRIVLQAQVTCSMHMLAVFLIAAQKSGLVSSLTCLLIAATLHSVTPCTVLMVTSLQCVFTALVCNSKSSCDVGFGRLQGRFCFSGDCGSLDVVCSCIQAVSKTHVTLCQQKKKPRSGIFSKWCVCCPAQWQI